MALLFLPLICNITCVKEKLESQAQYIESIVASSGFIGGGGTLLAPVLTIQGKSLLEIKIHNDYNILHPTTLYMMGSQGNGHKAKMDEGLLGAQLGWAVVLLKRKGGGLTMELMQLKVVIMEVEGTILKMGRETAVGLRVGGEFGLDVSLAVGLGVGGLGCDLVIFIFGMGAMVDVKVKKLNTSNKIH